MSHPELVIRAAARASKRASSVAAAAAAASSGGWSSFIQQRASQTMLADATSFPPPGVWRLAQTTTTSSPSAAPLTSRMQRSRVHAAAAMAASTSSASSTTTETRIANNRGFSNGGGGGGGGGGKTSASKRRSQGRGNDAVASSSPNGVLLREYIHSCLYDRADGYFAQPEAPVGQIGARINFNALLGQDDYARMLDARYARLASQCPAFLVFTQTASTRRLTPVEIFKPHYAAAIARYMLREMDPSYPLKVYELGGGMGTCAVGVLDHIRKEAPEVYGRMSYTSVEISPNLAKCQEHAVGHVAGHGSKRGGGGGGGGGSGPYRVERRDATDRAGWGGVDARPCFVIALEVLDNLPHDRLCRRNSGGNSSSDGSSSSGGDEGGEWMQTRVVAAAAAAADSSGVGGEKRENLLEEITEPLTDPLLARTSAAMELRPGGLWEAARRALDAVTGRPEIVYVPTGSMALLEALHAARPRHRLIAADFDALPGVRMSGTNAPLVASQEQGGKSMDHDSYLENPGGADVFFPTDFDNLVRIDAAAAARTTRSSRSGGGGGKGDVHGDDDDKDIDSRVKHGVVETTRDFMMRHADLTQTATASGYNPLLQDFSNTKFFLS